MRVGLTGGLGGGLRDLVVSRRGFGRDCAKVSDVLCELRAVGATAAGVRDSKFGVGMGQLLYGVGFRQCDLPTGAIYEAVQNLIVNKEVRRHR